MLKFFAVLLSILCVLFSGCNRISFNAEIVPFEQTFTKEFIDDNHTYGASYYNDEYNETDENIPKYIWDYEAPEYTVTVIRTIDEQSKIFNGFLVDYSKQISIVYAYTAIYARRPVLTMVNMQNGELTIKVKYPSNNGRADAVQPGTRFLIVVMDKIDFERVNFSFVK